MITFKEMCMAYDEDSDFPYHERYTKPGKRKEIDEFDKRMQDQQDAMSGGELKTYKCSCGYEFQQKTGKRITCKDRGTWKTESSVQIIDIQKIK